MKFRGTQCPFYNPSQFDDLEEKREEVTIIVMSLNDKEQKDSGTSVNELAIYKTKLTVHP